MGVGAGQELPTLSVGQVRLGMKDGFAEILGIWDGSKLGCLEMEGLAEGLEEGRAEILGS